jgi:hypothetical protein
VAASLDAKGIIEATENTPMAAQTSGATAKAIPENRACQNQMKNIIFSDYL